MSLQVPPRRIAQPPTVPTAAVAAALGWSLSSGPLAALALGGLGSAWIAMLAYHVGCVATALRLGARLGPRPRSGRLLLCAAGSAVLAALLGGVAAVTLPEGWFPMRHWRAWGLETPGDRWLLTYYVVVNPWVEEWFWRAALLGAHARRQLGTTTSVAFSIGAFTTFHLCVLWIAFGAAAGTGAASSVLGAGVLWTILRLRSGHTWWSAVSHQGADLGLAILYFAFLNSRP